MTPLESILLAVLSQQWGAEYAEKVARKADFMSPRRVDDASTGRTE